MTLPSLRKRIDRLDRRLLRALNQRAVLAIHVGRIKTQRGLPIFDARRETEVLRRVAKTNRGPLAAAAVRQIFRAILRHSRRLESAITTAKHRKASVVHRP